MNREKWMEEILESKNTSTSRFHCTAVRDLARSALAVYNQSIHLSVTSLSRYLQN